MILEMQLVLIYALSVIFMLVVQSFFATRQYGIKTLLEYKEHITLTGIAGRSDRAVKNSIVSLVLLLPAVVALVSIGHSSKGTVLALQIFLILRILYFIASKICWKYFELLRVIIMVNYLCSKLFITIFLVE